MLATVAAPLVGLQRSVGPRSRAVETDDDTSLRFRRNLVLLKSFTFRAISTSEHAPCDERADNLNLCVLLSPVIVVEAPAQGNQVGCISVVHSRLSDKPGRIIRHVKFAIVPKLVTMGYLLEKFFVKTFVHVESSRVVKSMGTFLPSSAGTRSLIRRLASSMRNGLHQSEWMAKAAELHSETIVFLVRLVGRANEQLFHLLFAGLRAPIVRIAGRWASIPVAMAAADIVSEVQLKVLELVPAQTPSRQGDFLEIAFATAGSTPYRRPCPQARPVSCRRPPDLDDANAGDDEEDADDSEEILPSRIEFAERRPGPQAIVFQAEQEARRRDWIRKAYEAVKDARHLEAVLLHCVDGWPISSSDRKTPDLARFLDSEPRRGAGTNSRSNWRTNMTDNVSFEDVLDMLMLEEPKPSYDVLLRWQQRYPQYREQLADFFATWSIQSFHAEQPPEVRIDEERLVRAGVEHAMEILRRQGRIIPTTEVAILESFDELVLAAIYLLHGDGYVVNITERVSKMLGREVLQASTFDALDRLEDRDLVLARNADPEAGPGGETRRYFTLTIVGERALAKAKATSKVVADALGDFG